MADVDMGGVADTPTDNVAAESQSDIADWTIELCLDWGTHKWAASYAFCKNGKRDGPPLLVSPSDDSHDVPMIATYFDGRFIHGHKLEALAQKNKDMSDLIVDHFKLLLYGGDEVSALRVRIMGVLQELGISLDDFITLHLKAVIEDIVKAIKVSEDRMCFLPNELDALLSKMQIRITVPQMWSHAARRRMQMAAKKAGLQLSVLAHEPQCALAYLVDKSAKRMAFRRILRPGDTILVADYGSGTGDLVLYELKDQLSPTSRLEVISKSSGEICGSYQVDLLIYEAFVKRKGEARIAEMAGKLELTPRDFERRALATIEKIKRDYKRITQDSPEFTGLLHGSSRKVYNMTIPAKDIRDALDKVLAVIIKSMDKMIGGKKPNIIQVTGGFAKSWYLMDRLQERYEDDDTKVMRPNDNDSADCFPVAIGGLLRYDNITKQQIPSEYGFAMLRREVFDKTIHWDAYDMLGRSRGRPQKYDKPWLLKSPYDNRVDVVDDRIVNIVSQGVQLRKGQIVLKDMRLEFYIPVEDPKISAEFVYLTKQFADHDPARDHKQEEKRKKEIKEKKRLGLLQGQEEEQDEERILQKGVHQFAHLEIPLPSGWMSKQGFKIVKGDGNERFYRVFANAGARVLEDDLQSYFDIEVTDEDGDVSMDDDTGEPKNRFWDTVWDGCHSEFAEP